MLYEIVVHRPHEDGTEEVIAYETDSYLASRKARRMSDDAEQDGCGYRYFYRPARWFRHP